MTDRPALLGGAPVIADRQESYQIVREVPFAERFARYVGAEYALPVSSGTAALVSALVGAGVQPGDEVITVAHSWYSTATSVLSVGAVPVFVDVDPKTFTLDPDALEAKLTAKTRAVMGVSLYGHPIDYARILPIVRHHGLLLIDDACQATGSAVGGAKVGALADLTVFSFSGVKPLASTGGGMVVTSSRALYERAMLAGQHPSMISESAHDPEVWALASTGGFGHNFRMDARCAERAFEQLERLEFVTENRRKAAQMLGERLMGVAGIELPASRADARHVYHMYTMILDEEQLGISRNAFLSALVAEGVPAIAYTSGRNFLRTPDGRPWEAGPLHQRELFVQLAQRKRCGPYELREDANIGSWRAGSLPVTERLNQTEINIQQRWMDPPFRAEETSEQFAYAVRKVLAHAEQIEAAVRSGELREHTVSLVSCDRSV